MRNFSIVLALIFVVTLGTTHHESKGAQERPKDAQASEDTSKIPQEDIDKKNPVKPSPEGIAAARKIYGYDCAMCHGQKGDGKGDLVESMKLTLHDWRDAASLEGKTDGELFYVITKGQGKMIGEGDRVSETVRWNLVNLVRSFSNKGSADKPAS